MSLLSKIRGAVDKVQVNTDLNEVRFRHTATWSDGVSCRFSVQDPNKTDAGYKLAQRLGGVPEVQDIRLLRVHVDDEAPGEGATLGWDGGTVKLLFWSQVSDFTGQAIGVLRLTR